MSNWKVCGMGRVFLASMQLMGIYAILKNRVGNPVGCCLTLFALCVSAGNAGAASESLDDALTTADARHLYSRTGFGFSLSEYDLSKGMTRREAIEAIMHGFNSEPAVDMPAWVYSDAPLFWARRDLDREERVRFERERDREISQLRQWWVSEMLQTPSPQTERLVLFWHDLMATSYHGVNYQSISMARQNAMFRQLGLGRFEDLLKALIRDPAMLNYLDNENSRKQKPNENFARELLERFSMGEGTFDENTVKNAARALTGYGVSQDYNMSFRFQTWKHDQGKKTLFGKTGQFNGDDLVELILKQPETAQFVATKFWNLLVSDSAPTAEQIQPFVSLLQRNDFDMKSLYQSILMSDDFWDENNRVGRVKSPIILQVAAARSLEYPKHHWQSISVTSASLGMSLFAPPNVSGWNEGTAYTTAGRLKQRKSIMDNLLDNGDASIAMNSGNQMGDMNNGMQADMAGNMMSDQGINITMAAEDYLGPVKYRFELRDDDAMLWRSEDYTWMHGHDTQRFGRINDMSNMPWHQSNVAPPTAHLDQASVVRVHFLNDNAGQDGDRNLFVRGVSITDRWYPASVGTQQSACVPRNSANAGNLYCKGFVDIPINSTDSTTAVSNKSYQVGDVRVRWAKTAKKRKRNRLELTLEHVVTPESTWRNISIAIHTNRKGGMDMRIDTFSCWPDCFTDTPPCLWVDEIDGVTRTWSFGLDNKQVCHYQSLTPDEKKLVDSLWMSLPALVAHAAEKEGDGRYAQSLQLWRDQLAKKNRAIRTSRYARSGEQFAVNPALARATPVTSIVTAPEVLLDNLSQLREQLQMRDLNVFDLLLPGLDAGVFPELAATSQQALARQLEVYSAHPISQLY